MLTLMCSTHILAALNSNRQYKPKPTVACVPYSRRGTYARLRVFSDRVLEQFSISQQEALGLVSSCIAILAWSRFQAQDDESDATQDFISRDVKRAAGSTRIVDLKWGVSENIGPRDYMEDAHHVKSSSDLFYASVFDGHGGSGSSEYLRSNMYSFVSSELALYKLDKIDTSEIGVRMKEVMNRAFTAADSALIDHIASLGDPECWSGSTGTVCVISRSLIVCSNVGDSKAVLCRQSKPVDLSDDHRPVSLSASGRNEIKRVNDSGAWISQSRVCGILAVSRAFGDYEFKGGRFELLNELRSIEDKQALKVNMQNPPVISLPHVSTLERSLEDEFIIIATDGLWDTMNSAQAVTFVRSELKKNASHTMQTIADSLVERALRCRTQDNVACVVIDLRGSQ
jgi:protein phosphatase 1A